MKKNKFTYDFGNENFSKQFLSSFQGNVYSIQPFVYRPKWHNTLSECRDFFLFHVLCVISSFLFFLFSSSVKQWNCIASRMNLFIANYVLFSYLFEHSWKCQSNAAFPHFLIENDLDKLCVLKSWNCPGVYGISSLVFEVVGSPHKAGWGYWI